MLMRWGRRVEAVVHLVQTVPGTLQPGEISLLYRTAKRAGAAGPLAQLGVGSGRGTAALALALQDAGGEGALFAIDPRTGSHDGFNALRESLHRLRLEARVEVMLADAERGAAALSARGDRLGLLYLEDLGRYETVAEALSLFLPLVAEGGAVALRGEPSAADETDLALRDVLGNRIDRRERVAGLTVSRLRPAPRPSV